jgi:hypothetical protein
VQAAHNLAVPTIIISNAVRRSKVNASYVELFFSTAPIYKSGTTNLLKRHAVEGGTKLGDRLKVSVYSLLIIAIICAAPSAGGITSSGSRFVAAVFK